MEADEEEIEEVEAFPPVDIGRGESIHSIVFFDDPLGTGSPVEEKQETDALRGALERAFEGRKSMEQAVTMSSHTATTEKREEAVGGDV